MPGLPRWVRPEWSFEGPIALHRCMADATDPSKHALRHLLGSLLVAFWLSRRGPRHAQISCLATSLWLTAPMKSDGQACVEVLCSHLGCADMRKAIRRSAITQTICICLHHAMALLSCPQAVWEGYHLKNKLLPSAACLGGQLWSLHGCFCLSLRYCKSVRSCVRQRKGRRLSRVEPGLLVVREQKLSYLPDVCELICNSACMLCFC